MKDWDSLLKYKVCATDTNSTVRTGMKLCEHFFPNFYDIKNTKDKCICNVNEKGDLKIPDGCFECYVEGNNKWDDAEDYVLNAWYGEMI